jgi:hypothetical protein
MGTASNKPKQLKISVDPEVASAFKAACAKSKVSMASKLSEYMAKCSKIIAKRKPELTTRRQRRAEVDAIRLRLELIRDAEERYRDAIPENLQGSVVFDNADQTVSQLEEALELLESAYMVP